jgi:hypothetical protein
MLPLLLLAASLLPSQQASAECIDTSPIAASAETQPLQGPAGVTVVLKVSSADDQSKNSHECLAKYQLLVASAKGGPASVVDINEVDAEYGRRLSFRLDGFSHDGKHVFGILSEGGKLPLLLLFDYDTTSGSTRLVDLRMLFAHTMTPACTPSFGVLGTLETGAIILELNSATPYSANGQWMLGHTNGKLLRRPQGQPIIALYELNGNAK